MFEPLIIKYATRLLQSLIPKDKDDTTTKAIKDDAKDEVMETEGEGKPVKVEGSVNTKKEFERKDIEFYKPDQEPVMSEDDIKRRLVLYYALCAKKHELLDGLIEVYVQVKKPVKKTMLRLSGGLMRSIGISSPHFLSLLSNFPVEAKAFIIHILHTVTESGLAPSPELISIVKEVYKNKVKDIRILIPIFPVLPKAEIIDYLPVLVELPPAVLKIALLKILHSKSHLEQQASPPISSAELLIALHTMDKSLVKEVKKIIIAIELCLEQKIVVKQEVLSEVLSHLIELDPIPQLFLRTTMQIVSICKQMMGFIIGILKRLIEKQVWKDSQLWTGFLKCCSMTMPYSIPVLLQLPVSQLEESLQRDSSLIADVIEYSNKHQSAAGQQPLPDDTLALLNSYEQNLTQSYK
jgi:symplekin